MQDGAPPHLCFLFMYGLPTIFLLGRLGVEDQHNSCHKVRVLSNVIFMGLDQNGSQPTKAKNLLNWNNKFEILAAVPCDLLKKSVLSIFPFALSGSVWALVWCKNCSNVAFCLGDKPFNIMYLLANHCIHEADMCLSLTVFFTHTLKNVLEREFCRHVTVDSLWVPANAD